jgi:hypothetical protein
MEPSINVMRLPAEYVQLPLQSGPLRVAAPSGYNNNQVHYKAASARD